MGDSDGCSNFIDVLAAGAPGMEDIDTQIVLIDVDFDFIGFRQDCDSSSGGVDTSAGLGDRDSLYAMYSQKAGRTRSGKGQAYFLCRSRRSSRRACCC